MEAKDFGEMKNVPTKSPLMEEVDESQGFSILGRKIGVCSGWDQWTDFGIVLYNVSVPTSMLDDSPNLTPGGLNRDLTVDFENGVGQWLDHESGEPTSAPFDLAAAVARLPWTPPKKEEESNA